MRQLASFWTGYLVVMVEGEQKERFLNLALTKGIIFWDLAYEQEQAVFKIKIKDYLKLRPLVRRTHCRVKIKDKVGRPFYISRGWRRKGFVCGALFFLLVFYFMTSLLWFIRISGNEEVSQEEILALLHELQVAPGTWKRKIDLDSLSERLVLEFEKITWASASLQGTLLDINVVEKKSIPEAEQVSGDLVAKKDGMIANILVLAGEPRVQEGDTVRRGDLLIEGIDFTVERESSAGEETAVKQVPIRARGVVEATVWYEGLGEVDLWETYTVPTGRTASSYLLRFNGKVIGSWGEAQSPYKNYRLKKINHQWVWRNMTLPVEVVTRQYFELSVRHRYLSLEEALQKAEEKAWEMLNQQLTPDLPVLRRHQEDRIQAHKVYRKILLETKENIAVPGSKVEEKNEDSP